MPLDPSIIGSYNPGPAPDVNAMMTQAATGMQNINTLERQRQQDALDLEDRAAAQKKEQEAAAVDALIPAYVHGIENPTDFDGMAALVPPDMQANVAPYLDQIRGLPPEQVRSLLTSSLLSSDRGKAFLENQARQRTYQVQLQQAETAAAREAREAGEAGKPKPMSAYEAERTKLDREKFEAEKQKAARVASGEEPPVQLQKGETWNPETQKVELVKGTKLYNDTAKKHSADYKGATVVADKVEEAKAKIDYLLSEDQKSGFEGNFGGYNAAYVSQYMPGQTQDVLAKLDSLKADLKNAGLELMRTGGSIGQITEREWPIIEQQLANLTPYIGEQEARDVLANVRARLDNIVSRATEAYDMQWGDTQFYAPVKAKPVTTGSRGNTPKADGGDTNGDGVIDFNDL